MRDVMQKDETRASGCKRGDCTLDDQMGRIDSREVENGW
jgi:hypothetical protein